jgi:hypothetical protein
VTPQSTLQQTPGATGGEWAAGDGAEQPVDEEPVERIAHAAARGTIAAMAMTGMRALTVNLGIVEEPPPRAILRQKAHGLMKLVPRKRRRAVQELAHWFYGGVGGAMFGALPASIRLKPWAGPAYGLALWAGFEAGIAPVLGLKQAKKVRLGERLALAADHLLYGLVLSEMRARPRS